MEPKVIFQRLVQRDICGVTQTFLSVLSQATAIKRTDRNVWITHF